MKRKVKLDSLCDFINGGAWSDKEYVDDGIAVLKVSNCKLQGFDLSNVNYLSVSSAEKYKEHKLELKDVVVTTVGSHPTLVESAAGRAFIVNEAIDGFYLNQNAVCIRSKDKNILNQKYLGYLAKSTEFKNIIQMSGRGAANQMRIAIGTIKDFEFVLPRIDEQNKISHILSAYDDLIENNQKQIKLLEEAVQRLYKEWFVDLRFPGYENVEIVDGLPKGWDIVSIKEIAEFKRGKTITKDTIIDGNIPVIAGGVQPAYYHNVANTVAPVITVSASGANAGYTALHNINVWASDCSFVDGDSKNIYYLFCFLKNSPETMQNLQRGSAQPHVYVKDINEIKILRPSKKVLERFDSFANAYFSAIAVNERIIKELTEARNRLLPKLMSGEVEV